MVPRRIIVKHRRSDELQEKLDRQEAAVHTEPPRLGDRIGSALESVGVTSERWAAVKAEIGLPATCRCEARREWLNRLDEKLGLAEKLTTFASLLGWK